MHRAAPLDSKLPHTVAARLPAPRQVRVLRRESFWMNLSQRFKLGFSVWHTPNGRSGFRAWPCCWAGSERKPRRLTGQLSSCLAGKRHPPCAAHPRWPMEAVGCDLVVPEHTEVFKRRFGHLTLATSAVVPALQRFLANGGPTDLPWVVGQPLAHPATGGHKYAKTMAHIDSDPRFTGYGPVGKARDFLLKARDFLLVGWGRRPCPAGPN